MHAQGAVRAETDGGDVTVVVTGRLKGPRPEIYIATKGGDVNLTLPGNLAADLDIEVSDADAEEGRIVSEFPQVAVKRGAHNPDRDRQAGRRRTSGEDPGPLGQGHHQARPQPVMASLWQDLRYALRRLGQQPRFAALAIATLALGIGATTIIFSVIQNVLLDPFPYLDAGRVVSFHIHDQASARPGGRSVFRRPSSWRTRTRVTSSTR
jgi:hypothetical protein